MTARKKRSLLRHHVSLTPESGQLEPLPSHGKSQFHPGLPCHLPCHTALHLSLSYFSGHRPIPPHLTIPSYPNPPPYHLILPIPYHLPTLPYSPYHMPQSEPGESHHLPLMSWRTQVTRLVTKQIQIQKQLLIRVESDDIQLRLKQFHACSSVQVFCRLHLLFKCFSNAQSVFCWLHFPTNRSFAVPGAGVR